MRQKSGKGENEIEGSDRFEDCNEILQIPLFHLKGPLSTTNTLRSPAFTNYTDPGNRSQLGLFDGQNRPW